MDQSSLPNDRSIQAFFTAALAACAIACAGLAALAQTGATMIAIDKMEVGAPPADFESRRTGQGRPAQWMVVADATAAGGRAIEQTSTDKTDYRFPLAIYKSVTAGNLDVVLRFKAVAGTVDRAGGIAVRLSGPDNYYVVRANALEDNVRFYRVVNGRREQLAGADTKVTANEWHQLGLRAEGEKFTIMFDGKTLYTASDRTFTAAGRIALWTKADSVTRFDSIAIKTLP
jgi:hypothetical protein